ncbi:MAG: helix-hairpin-helix domain-containing protein [Candidatus Hodarchaeales archaeon]
MFLTNYNFNYNCKHTPNNIKKLKENLHFSTINELVEKHPDKIGEIPSITPKKAKDWIDEGKKLLDQAQKEM